LRDSFRINLRVSYGYKILEEKHTNSAKTTISRIDFAELAEISLLAGAWFSASREGRSEYIMVG
jgi:hypothetical protein